MILKYEEALTVADAMRLRAVTAGEPQLITPSGRMQCPVRWAHIIGQDRPGHVLEGGELILSTLPRLTETRENITEALHQYLADLDEVGAAALAVEVLEDRPHLLRALESAARYRESRPNAAELVPIFVFSRMVRFQAITEELHRELVSRQLGRQQDNAQVWDPIISSATNLFDDLAAPGGLPADEVEARAAALGMPREVRYVPLVARVYGNTTENSAQKVIQQVSALATTARQAAQSARLPALIGAGAQSEFCILLAANGTLPPETLPERFADALQEAVAHRRSYELLPRYVLGAGEEPVPLTEAAAAMRSTAGIAHTAEKLADSDRRSFWKAEELGLTGLLVHLAESSETGWFLRRHLRAFQHKDAEQLRQLVHAAVKTGGNKAELARELNISRPTLYSRITRLERLTGAPLYGEHLTKLHIALLLDELPRRELPRLPLTL